jgi:hypothetical protein
MIVVKRPFGNGDFGSILFGMMKIGGGILIIFTIIQSNMVMWRGREIGRIHLFNKR